MTSQPSQLWNCPTCESSGFGPERNINLKIKKEERKDEREEGKEVERKIHKSSGIVTLTTLLLSFRDILKKVYLMERLVTLWKSMCPWQREPSFGRKNPTGWLVLSLTPWLPHTYFYQALNIEGRTEPARALPLNILNLCIDNY